MTNRLQPPCKIATCRRANAVVAFAMLAPLLMMTIFGIVALGLYLSVVQNVQHLAAEAARSSSAGASHAERLSLATNYVASHAGTYRLIDVSHVTVNATFSASAPSNLFVVTVQYDASGLFNSALPPLLAPSALISRSAAIAFAHGDERPTAAALID